MYVNWRCYLEPYFCRLLGTADRKQKLIIDYFRVITLFSALIIAVRVKRASESIILLRRITYLSTDSIFWTNESKIGVALLFLKGYYHMIPFQILCTWCEPTQNPCHKCHHQSSVIYAKLGGYNACLPACLQFHRPRIRMPGRDSDSYRASPITLVPVVRINW